MKRFDLIGRRRLVPLLALLLAAAATIALALAALPRLTAAGASARRIPIYCTDRPGKVVSLTFDAAWGDEDTPKLLEIFERYGIHVTFFVVGEWTERCADSVKALAAAGHEVMNHSDTHPHMPRLSREEMRREIDAANDKIEALTGVRPTLFRAPYGDYDNALIETLDAAGMQCVQWDVDSLDWKDPPVDDIVRRVTQKVQSGSIVLFHNAAKHTPDALPAIIEALKADGYTFLKASEMVYTSDCPVNHEGRQLHRAE